MDNFEDKALDLYCDVDGVLFRYPRPVRIFPGCSSTKPDRRKPMNMRPNATDFLYWCHERFNCHWLTAWRDSAPILAKNIYACCAVHWPVCDWKNHKTEEIDFTRNFAWIDDDPSDVDLDNIKMYKKAGTIGELVLADPYDDRELIRIKWRLRALLKQHKIN